MAALRSNRPLLARITAPENLHAAWLRVRARRAGGGVDGQSVEIFAAHAERELERLREELLTESYAPQPLLEHPVPKPGKPGQWRRLALPAVRDKVAQEAVRRVLEGRLDRMFLPCSYGYRPGRGPQRAVRRVSHALTNEKRTWVALGDIDDFFASIGHDRLLAALEPHLADRAVLSLITLWLQTGSVDGNGRWRDGLRGLPQGCAISPVLANVYLTSFDQSTSSGDPVLVRYADDFVLLCRTREEATAALDRAREFLEGRLHLHLNPHPRPVVAEAEGFAFLGIWFHGGDRSIAAARLPRAAERLRRAVAGAGAPHARLARINETVAGWNRYYGSLLEPPALRPLRDLHQRALAAFLAQMRTTGEPRTRTQAAALLAQAELLGNPVASERRRTLAAIVRTAFAARPGRGPGEWPDGDTAGPPPVASGPPPDPTPRVRSVAARVRRRKREFFLRSAEARELVLASPGTFLGMASGRLIVRRGRRTLCEAPAARLSGVTLAAPGVSLSAAAMRLCAAHRVPIFCLSPSGQVEALVIAPARGGTDTALAQLHATNDPARACDLARDLVRGKIRAQATLLKYVGKSRRQAELTAAKNAAVAAMTELARALANVSPTAEGGWRGRLFAAEGRAASHYWSVLRRVFAPYVSFPGRARRGARDLVNSLLNYGYAVLRSRVHIAALRADLDPRLGLLHSIQKGRPSLVFDLMEEFRAPFVDRTVIALITRRRPLAVGEDGLLTDDTRRLLLRVLHTRLSALIQHRGRTRTLLEVIDAQAAALAAALRNRTPYRSFAPRW